MRNSKGSFRDSNIGTGPRSMVVQKRTTVSARRCEVCQALAIGVGWAWLASKSVVHVENVSKSLNRSMPDFCA